MIASMEYLLNKATAAEIGEHLARCDSDFVPPLSGRVGIKDFAQKIVNNATRLEAWSGSTLVGLVAAYCNDKERRIAYITSVSVLKLWAGKGIATHLVGQCVECAKIMGMQQIRLEVEEDNMSAIKLYEKSGFVSDGTNAPFIKMNLYLKKSVE